MITWAFFFYLFILSPPFLLLCTRTAHVFLIDMMSFVHLRTFLFLVVSVAQVLIVTCQDGTSGKQTLLITAFFVILGLFLDEVRKVVDGWCFY